VNGEAIHMMDNASENEESHVSFSISGFGLDPDKVSRLLGIRPDYSHRRGDVKKSSKSGKSIIYSDGHWSLCSELSVYEPFEMHLDALLDRLEGKEAVIKSLAEENEIRFYCDLWETIGVELPAHIIRRIADFSASLSITIYN
jgi:hypothetical protein